MAKILIVDDYPTNREFLTSLLSHRRYHLLEAADGEEALAVTRAEHPDLVITDLLMPRMDGYEYLRCLRSDPGIRNTRVILYSAKYNQWETDMLDQAAGLVTRHLEKPSQPEDILRAVDEALSSALPPPAVAAEQEFDRAHMRLITDKLARKVHILDALNRLGQKMALEPDPTRLLETVCGQAREILRAEQAVVSISEDGQSVRHFFLAGMERGVVRCFAAPPLEQAMLCRLGSEPEGAPGNPGTAQGGKAEQGQAGRRSSDQVEAVRDRHPHRWNALPAGAKAAFPAGYPPVRNLVWVPVASPSRWYGALYASNKRDGAGFTEDDESVAATLGLQLGVAYENARRAEALAQSQGRLDAIISSAMDAVISINREQRIVLFNPAAEKLFGISAGEVLGQSIERLIPNRFRAAHKHHVEGFGRTGTTSRRMGALGVIFGLRANGEEFPIEASISQVEMQGEKLFTVILRDISSRLQAEEALRASEDATHRHLAELENIYKRAPVGLCFLDTELRYRAINDLLAEYDGLAARDHLGRTVREVLPEQADRLEPLMRRVMETNTPVRNIEASTGATRKEPGLERYWLVSYYPVKNEVVRGLNVVVVDITERKHSEEALRQTRDQLARTNSELERRVEERTAQLVEANTNLQTFANSAAHDLRSPLRAIKSFSSMTLEDCGPQLGSEGRAYLQRVIQAADQMGLLLSDLLDYSKLSQAEVKLQAVDLQKSVAEALALLEAEIRAKQAQVSVSDALPPVTGHPATVQLIIANFISNALKFIPQSTQPRIRLWAELVESGKLRVDRPAGSDSQPSTLNHQLVRLWIEDNGIGIEPKDLPKLFTAFQRLHGKQAYPGTGLGLAIVRKGAERMGGRVGVESEPGKGSRFWVQLPTAET